MNNDKKETGYFMEKSKEDRDAEMWIKLAAVTSEFEDCTPEESLYLIEQLLLLNQLKIKARHPDATPVPPEQMPLRFVGSGLDLRRPTLGKGESDEL